MYVKNTAKDTVMDHVLYSPKELHTTHTSNKKITCDNTALLNRYLK